MNPNVGNQLDLFAGKVRILGFPEVTETRGQLVEFSYQSLPFTPQRTFVIKNVPPGTVRGGHAHKTSEQLLVCLRGRVSVDLVRSRNRARIDLDRPTLGLLVGAGVWAQQTYESFDTELLVFASMSYDPTSYISDPDLCE